MGVVDRLFLLYNSFFINVNFFSMNDNFFFIYCSGGSGGMLIATRTVI